MPEFQALWHLLEQPPAKGSQVQMTVLSFSEQPLAFGFQVRVTVLTKV